MPVVDASVWVANYHPGDPAHERCSAWLRGAIRAGEPLTAPSLVVAEVAAAITRITGRAEQASDIVEQILGLDRLELVELDRARAERAAGVAASARVRGADAIYLALAAERADVLFSVDRQQRERGSLVVEVRIP
jgi:predicted nucleic acid-binding protein